MAKRFINADELELEYYDLSIHGTMAVKSVLPVFTDLLEKQPTADVVEIRHGNWIEWWDDNYLTFCHKCSECGRYPLTKEETMHDEVLSKYCPNCGAKMDKGEEENAEIICSK